MGVEILTLRDLFVSFNGLGLAVQHLPPFGSHCFLRIAVPEPTGEA